MANLVYDLVLPELLINYVREYDNEVLRNQFTLDAFLPARNIEDLEYRIRKGTISDVDVAKFRAWDTPAPMTGRAGVTRIRGEIIPLSRQIPLGEEETLRLRALERQTNDPIVNAIYDDAELMVRAVQGRLELARGQLLTTGKVTLAENGLAIEADFGLAGDHKVTAGTLWTDHTNSTPLSDLLTWQDKYIDDTGVAPGTILMSTKRIADLLLNAEIRAAAAANGTTPARINRETLEAIFLSQGLPPISLYDVKVRVDGTQTNVIDPKFVLLLPAAGEPFGDTFYGITAEAIKLRSKGMITQQAMPGIVAVVTEEEHPVQTFTVATAVALPVMPNPQLLMVATVTA